MTSWSVPGSPVRYYQCPFCARTFCSAYGEVFRSRAGARRVELAEAPDETPAEPAALPMPTADEIRWAGVKARAARWFRRLEREEQQLGAPAARTAEAVEEDDLEVTVVVPETSAVSR